MASSDRLPPRRTINKMDAIRHLLHASIRLHFTEEDPFVVHMIVQSCDKLIGDLCKQRGITSVADIERYLRPERADEFWRVHRKSFNYFKHADFDSEKELAVYEIVLGNELQIFFNVIRAMDLGTPYSAHLQVFFTYMVIMHPDSFSQELYDNFPGTRDVIRNFDASTRSEILDAMRAILKRHPVFIAERKEDLRDAIEAGTSRPSRA